MDWITQELALGDMKDSYDVPPEIDLVLNAATEVPTGHDKPCLRLPIWDGQEIPFELLDRARRFLEASDEAGYKVLVHCVAGISRSPSIVAMHIALKRNIKFCDALDLVRAKRPQVEPAYAIAKSVVLYIDQYRKSQNEQE